MTYMRLNLTTLTGWRTISKIVCIDWSLIEAKMLKIRQNDGTTYLFNLNDYNSFTLTAYQD